MGGIAVVRRIRPSGYDALRVVLGAILLAAAALKAHQLATEPVIAPGLLNSRWFLISVVEFELLFGLWLLSGLYARPTWYAATGCFVLLAGVSVYKALSGDETCGCFGNVKTHPWWATALDAALVLALLRWRPSGRHACSALATAPASASRFARVLVLVGVLVGTGLWIARARAVFDDNSSPLWVDAEALDFGEVWAEPSFRWSLPIQNRTPKDVEIQAFESSCNCSSIDPKSTVVPAGDTIAVSVELDLRPKKPEAAGLSWREFSTDILPVTKHARPGAMRWRVHGLVRRYPIALAPDPPDFGEQLIRGRPFPAQVVHIQCLLPVTGLTVEHDDTVASAEVSPTGPSPQYELRITPSAKLAVGQHRLRLGLKATLGEPWRWRDLPPLALEVVANVHNDVYLSPRVVNFGARNIGEIAEETCLVGSRSGRPFVLLAVSREARGSAEVDRMADLARHKYCFRVRQHIADAGAHASQLEFVVREEGSPESYALPLSLWYHGLPP